MKYDNEKSLQVNIRNAWVAKFDNTEIGYKLMEQPKELKFQLYNNLDSRIMANYTNRLKDYRSELEAKGVELVRDGRTGVTSLPKEYRINTLSVLEEAIDEECKSFAEYVKTLKTKPNE